MTKYALTLATGLLLLSACTKSEPITSTAGQGAAADANAHARLCEVSDWRRNVVGAACKAGQKVVFLPQRWGNEQLPVMFAAVNCDLRYPVVQTNGAVTCIYVPLAVEGTPAVRPTQKPG